MACNNECSICLQDLDNKCKTLRCKHTFHAKCINSWCEIHNTCPTCRKSIHQIISSEQEENMYENHVQNVFEEILEEVFDHFDNEFENSNFENAASNEMIMLSEYLGVSCETIIRERICQDIMYNLKEFERNFMKLKCLSKYVRDINFRYIDMIYEVYGIYYQIYKQFLLHEQCITDTFVNLSKAGEVYRTQALVH